jgi:hypothetical protein
MALVYKQRRVKPMDCPKNYVFGEEFYKDYDCLGCGKWLDCFFAWLPAEEKASYERMIIKYEKMPEDELIRYAILEGLCKNYMFGWHKSRFKGENIEYAIKWRMLEKRGIKVSNKKHLQVCKELYAKYKKGRFERHGITEEKFLEESYFKFS